MQAKSSFCSFSTQCLLLLTVSNTVAINYCSPKYCKDSKQHTLCRFQSPNPASTCIDYEAPIKSDEQRQALLDKINSRRNKIASGDVRSFPAAEKMMKLVWSKELELSAQKWADQCVGQNTPDHVDICRDLGSISVGQIIASVYGEAPGLSPLALVDVWYIELLNSNSSVLPRYRPSMERGFSHYDYFTQLVWARSREVGCGSVKFKEKLKHTQGQRNRTVHRLVCNFAPSGNIVNESVYVEGPPCSRCPGLGRCDSTYSSLCSIEDNELQSDLVSTELFNIEESILSDEDNSSSVSDATDENSTIFDYFSEVYDFKRQPLATATTKRINPCKDAVAVDDFVELLKKKLTTDPMFKDILLTKHQPQNGYTDSSFKDPSVAAFVSKIYSKKEPTTTTKLPEPDYVNSTLLVDLIEAVIFRSDSKTFSTEEPKETSPSSSDINPIKIQAELGAVKINHDFTGHYFFPEDNTEESIQETTDNYYDVSNLPVSDVISEIESIKRDKFTHDFLDDIIDSDTESDENNEGRKKRSGIKTLPNDYLVNDYYDIKNLKQGKISIRSGDYYDSNIIVKYSDLLRKIAADFKLLKLNERFHCSCSQTDFIKLDIAVIFIMSLCYIFIN